ncbi:MAG: protein-L-isoaspartate O-methyltransferase [Candidatus Diapherotrites archaeon]
MNKEQLIVLLKREGFEEKIVRAFEKVHREDFVQENMKKLAYENIALPITESETISQPSTIALALSMLKLKENQKVLEIGSGCGYVLALIAEIVGQNGRVLGIEIVKELAEKSKKLLKNHKNIEIFNKNGNKGFPEEAPFDRIVISAALEKVPREILEQLKEKGILVAPIGPGFMQTLTSIKRAKDEFIITKEIPGFIFVHFVE